MSAYTPPCQHAKDEQCVLCTVPSCSGWNRWKPPPRETLGFKVPFDVDDVVAYNRGVADERARIAKALSRAAASEDGGYSESSQHVLKYWARLVRDGELP